MSYQVSAVVMAHPVRSAAANRLAAALGRGATVVYDPQPDGPPSPLRAAVPAWSRCTPGASHHLVVQDDVELSARFWELTEAAVHRLPGSVLALYTNSFCDNGAAARVALLAGYTWMAPTPQDYFPTLAVVMPCAVAHEFAAWSRPRAAAGEREDDRVLARFLAERGHDARLRVPTLVEHRGLVSVAGYDHQGRRRSLCFQSDHPGPDPGLVTEVPPAWPMFVDGHAILRVAAPHAGVPPQSLVGDDHLSHLGVSAARIRRLAGEAFGRPQRSGGRPTSALRFVRELTLACYSLGWLLSTGRPDRPGRLRRTALQDAALRSYLEPGSCVEPVEQLLDGAWTALHEGLHDGVAAMNTPRLLSQRGTS